MATENKSVQEFDALPGGLLPTDLWYIVRADIASPTGYYDYKGAASDILSRTITYAAAAALIAASELVPGVVYGITDAVTTGTIYLQANSTTTFFKQGVWAHLTQLKSFGSIDITAGAAGSVDTITVNGVNILPAPVAYITSRTATATAVAASINTTSGTHGYTAYGINQTIVIQANAVGVAANTYAISGTATTLTLGNINNMANGVAQTTRNLSIQYDFSANQIYECYDLVANIKYNMSQAAIDIAGYNPILYFRWGDLSYYLSSQSVYISAWHDTIINDSDFNNCFCINTAFGGSEILSCDFGNSVFYNGNFGASELLIVQMNDSSGRTFNFEHSIISNLDFEEFLFDSVDFSYSNLANVDYFEGLSVSSINMSNSVINETNFQLSLQLVNSLDGSANRGLVDSPITLGVIPNKFFPDRAIVQSNTLVGASAELKIGIETDADDCMLPQTAIATLNSLKVITSDPQSATAIRNIIATPKVATITSGNFRVWVSGKIGI